MQSDLESRVNNLVGITVMEPLMWVKPGLRTQLPHSICSEFICGKYNNIFARYTNRNQFDILKTDVADVRKGQTDMPYNSDHQALTKQSMRHQVCIDETISEFSVTNLISMLKHETMILLAII